MSPATSAQPHTPTLVEAAVRLLPAVRLFPEVDTTTLGEAAVAVVSVVYVYGVHMSAHSVFYSAVPHVCMTYTLCSAYVICLHNCSISAVCWLVALRARVWCNQCQHISNRITPVMHKDALTRSTVCDAQVVRSQLHSAPRVSSDSSSEHQKCVLFLGNVGSRNPNSYISKNSNRYCNPITVTVTLHERRRRPTHPLWEHCRVLPVSFTVSAGSPH
jgi:hypothetical protein